MSQQPIISVLHPTARVRPSEGFPLGWLAAFRAWREKAYDSESIEYVIAVHESRWAEFWSMESWIYSVLIGPELRDEVPAVVDGFPVKVVKNKLRDCVVDQTNVAFAACSGMLITGAADDYYPPQDWDSLLLGIFAYEVHPECVIVASTGATPERDRELMIGGAATRAVFERRGYVLDPDFESMFADNWWAFENRRDEAAGLLKIVERLDIQFEHRHPIFGKGQMDEVYALQNRPEAYRHGAITFDKKVTGRKMILLCLPGETFRNEWVANTVNLIQRLGTRYITATQWCYTSNVYCTRIELAKAAIESPADYVLWIDDDNLVTAEQVQVLIEDLEAHPQLGGVTGWCWCDHNEEDGKIAQTWTMSVGRQRWPDLGCLRFTPEDLKQAFIKSPLITSDDVAPHAFWSGFPCVLMHRSTLAKLTPQAFAPMLNPGVKFGFVGEDVAFFVNAHQQGVKFAVDIRVKVPHVKWRAIEPGFSVESLGPQRVESSAAD